ncbi:HINT domain-containing protein [Aeoliella sp. ICT_H6.2]|uniref:HINT domain-containing protein n=1 Tax=Aeoliella straminimaris TaxID=2954799 RepID=A0A9X2JGL2_9BACT|nr:polymorphic toxin-type HINT domain-containing protein [Aeoliella straminimaris]MCO6044517.1 HINT domain-containing protein [Aeoliella straminimaris]
MTPDRAATIHASNGDQTNQRETLFVQGQGWTAAGELQPGDLVSTATGEWLPVQAVTDTHQSVTVYNFRVSEYHTYFIAPADLAFDVWVHNACNAPLAAVDGAHHLDDFIDDLVDGWRTHQAAQRSAINVIENHHLVSNKMLSALDDVGFAGGHALRNRRSLQYMSSPGGHVGYEDWHRIMDDDMVRYIRQQGPDLTENALLQHIHNYYQQPELSWRIPGVNLGF